MVWFKRISLALLVTVLVGVGGGYFYLRQSLPDYNARLDLPGLTGVVTVTRDANAVPHIIAENDLDAYFTVGYVQAQDRLWQLEINRRAIEGRLSEAFGAATIDTDKFLRALDFYRTAQRIYEKLDPDTRAILDAYSRGVNTYLETRSGPLPPEFLILGIKPGIWTPAHTIAWGKMMALDLGDNYRMELARLRLSAKLTPEQMAEFFPPYPGDSATVLPDLRALYRQLAGEIDWKTFASIAPDKPDGVGSNNWVISGTRTQTSKPLLANDPHLGLNTPAIWYYVHIKTPNMQMIGASLPGTPSVLLGRNNRIAWGFTNSGPDVQDLFIEKIAPDNPNAYMTPNGPANFESREEVIAVKGADPITITLRKTRNGPVLSDVIAQAKADTPEGYVLALAWTAIADDDLTTRASIRLGRAQNWEEFIAAAREFHAPQQNMVYADIDGNIGYVAPGRVPMRKPENDIKGKAPSPGWDKRYEWTGFIPFEELPRRYNPANGVVVTANAKIVPNDYRFHLTDEWAEPQRTQRIEEMLAALPQHSIDSFKHIQGDVLSGRARLLLPFLAQAEAETDLGRQGLALLQGWNGEMIMDAPQGLIFSAWFRRMASVIANDETDGLGDVTQFYRLTFLANVLSDKNGQSRWCDDVTTAQAESCAYQMGKAMDEAMAELAQTYGKDPTSWNWGAAHIAVSTHRPFSEVPVLRDIFELRAPTPGDGHTVNVGAMRHTNKRYPYANQHAASLRSIYDLSNLDQSIFIYSTGQSGNPLSPFYGNLKRPWAELQYLPLDTRPETYEKGAIGVMKLSPRR